MRPVDVIDRIRLAIFQSTHPLRGATNLTTRRGSGFSFQSTHPLRGATFAPPYFGVDLDISIHAPLAGCDVLSITLSAFLQNFNPRTPCGVRQKLRALDNKLNEFQSTHPLRGATLLTPFLLLFFRYFNPRTPCGVRQQPYP